MEAQSPEIVIQNLVDMRLAFVKMLLEMSGEDFGDRSSKIEWRSFIGAEEAGDYTFTNLSTSLVDNLSKFGICSGRWSECVKTMASWYIGAPINGVYDQSKQFFCPLVGRNVRSDCSGFTTACLWLYGVKNLPLMNTAGISNEDSAWARAVKAAGFTYHTFDPSNLHQFSICCSSGRGHVTIVGENTSKDHWNCYDFGNDRGPQFGKPLPMSHFGNYGVMIWPPIGS